MFNPYQVPQQPYNCNAPATPFLPDYRPQQPQPTTPQTNVNWIYVNGIEGARSQIVQPGQVSWMMDNNDPVVYVKSVDGMGTASLKAFSLTEITAPSAPQADLTGYAKMSDLDSITKRLKSIEDFIGGLNA